MDVGIVAVCVVVVVVLGMGDDAFVIVVNLESI